MASSLWLELGYWIVMRPILNAISLGPDPTAALSVTTATTLLPCWSRNNCFAVTLAFVVVSCCTTVPFCQLKGYLDPFDCDKVTELWSDLAQGVNGDGFACMFYALASSCSEKTPQWFMKYRAAWHRHMWSDRYTKAWTLGLTSCFTADIETWMEHSKLWWARTALYGQKHPQNSSQG